MSITYQHDDAPEAEHHAAVRALGVAEQRPRKLHAADGKKSNQTEFKTQKGNNHRSLSIEIEEMWISTNVCDMNYCHPSLPSKAPAECRAVTHTHTREKRDY